MLSLLSRVLEQEYFREEPSAICNGYGAAGEISFCCVKLLRFGGSLLLSMTLLVLNNTTSMLSRKAHPKLGLYLVSGVKGEYSKYLSSSDFPTHLSNSPVIPKAFPFLLDNVSSSSLELTMAVTLLI